MPPATLSFVEFDYFGVPASVESDVEEEQIVLHCVAAGGMGVFHNMDRLLNTDEDLYEEAYNHAFIDNMSVG